jgi:hypothetical protein
MSALLYRRHESNASAKLRLPFIIYCIIMLFQALIVHVLADVPISANTVDPVHSHIPSKTVDAQIVGGDPATEGEFPYVTALYLYDLIRCSGVILSSRWVLTGAQCMVNQQDTNTSTTFELEAPKSNYTIGYGSVSNTTLDHVSISNVWVHP